MYDKKENQTTTQTAEQKNPIQVADRLFAVIEELSKSGPTGLIELSNTLGLHKSTTHRLLTSLMYMDYVRQDEESGKYSLSFKLLEISSRILGHIDVLSTIQRSSQISAERPSILSNVTDWTSCTSTR